MGDTTRIDDKEIDLLEDIRRYGKNHEVDDTEYFTLPPKRTEMMTDWRKWRTSINDVMSDLIGKTSTGNDTLTLDPRMKAPNFFKGDMSIHGQRLKDEYGGKPIDETDDQSIRTEKRIIDENFFLFGIPRISLQRINQRNDGLTCQSRRLSRCSVQGFSVTKFENDRGNRVGSKRAQTYVYNAMCRK